MRTSFAIVPLLSLVGAAPVGDDVAASAAAPPSGSVTMNLATYGGSGCPQGSLEGQIAGDASAITAKFSKFLAKAGPGTKPTDARQTCQLTFRVLQPGGWQFTVVQSDIKGSANLPDSSASGTGETTFYWSGEQAQYKSVMTVPGPLNADFEKSDTFGSASLNWSPCGKEVGLNVKTEVRIEGKPSSEATLSVSSQDLKFTEKLHLVWQPCTA